MRTVDVPPTAEDGDRTDAVGQQTTLLQARRKFIQGSVGVSAFIATLANRPAFAGDGWVSYQTQQVCSVNPSHTLINTGSTGACYHCDHYSCNINNWTGCSTSHKFSSFGWTPTVSTCGFSDDTFWNCFNKCYGYTPGSNPYYMFGTNGPSSSQLNACWFACGFVNAACWPSQFGYSVTDFATACTRAFANTNCSGGVSNLCNQLCTVIQSICNQNYIGNGIDKNTYGSKWCW